MNADQGKPTAAASWMLYILNLLLPGLFFLVLLALWVLKRQEDNTFLRLHVRQAFAGALTTTVVFYLIYMAIAPVGGYRSMEGLIGLEFYYMALVPLFFIPGLLALMKVFAGKEFRYPIVGQFAG